MALVFLSCFPVMLLTQSGDLGMWFARQVWAPSGPRRAGVRLVAKRERLDAPVLGWHLRLGAT